MERKHSKKRNVSGRFCAQGILAILLILAAGVSAATVTVVSPTSDLPKIIRGAGSDNILAANDLADYLSQVCGRTIAVVTEYTPPGTAIHIGRSVFVDSYAPEVASLKADGFVMKYKSFFGQNHIILAGNQGQGSLWAVEQFLKDYCGVRWLFPDPVYGEVVPSKPTVTIDSLLNEIHEPDYTSRSNFGMYNFYPGGGGSQLRGRPSGSPHGSHGLQYIFNNGAYSGEIFDLHPEWFAWFDGQRNWWEYGNGWQICLANPDTVTHAIQYCIDYFIANPGSDTVSIGMNDGNGLCQDTLSQNLRNSVSPPYTDSEMSWQWVNQVAAGVAAYNGGQFADKWVEALAYSWTSNPPRFALESNVAITNTIVLDHELGLAEDWADPPANCQSINLYTYSWGTNFLGFRHYPTAMRDFLRWGRDTLGALAHTTECQGDWSFDGPKYYSSQIFQWDADADPVAVMTEFCDASYGSASTEMKAFWDRLEAVWEARDPVPYGTTNMRWLFYQWVGWAEQCYATPNDELREYTLVDVTELDSRIANAVALAPGNDVGVQYRIARMEEAWNYYRTMILSKLNYLDAAPSTLVNSLSTRATVRALAQEIADLRYDRLTNMGKMMSYPVVNPRLSNSNKFQVGWMTAYTFYSNELGLLHRACTAISDHIQSTSGTPAAIQYWEAVGSADTLYDYALTQISMLNNGPILTDLLTNGDFEAGSLSGWSTTGSTGIASGGAHSATYSARLISGACYGGATISQTVPVTPQERYRLTVWNKNISTPPYAGVATEALVEFYSGAQLVSDGEPRRAMFRSSNPADGWTQLQSTVTVPAGVDSAKISVKIKNSAETRIDDVAFERIKDAPLITHGSLVDTFDMLALDTSQWVPTSGTAGTIPPRIDEGWLLFDSPTMYDINSLAQFDELLDYSAPDRYRLRIRLSLPQGANPGSPVSFGIKTGTGKISTSQSGMFCYHYFSFGGNPAISCFNYQSGSSTHAATYNLPISAPATDVWYTFYFDPVNITIYASDSGYEEDPGNLVTQYAHGISNITAEGSVYLKIGKSVNLSIDEVLLHRPPTVCGDPGTEYLDADLLPDCYVNTDDWSVFALAWLGNNCSWPNWCNGADIDESTNVNLIDFERFMSQWMQCSDPANSSCL